MLIPRMIAVVIIAVMSVILPFIYFSLAIKWWVTAFFMGLAFALATPNHLVGKNWDKDFLTLPIRTICSFLKIDVPTFELPKLPKLPFKFLRKK